MEEVKKSGLTLQQAKIFADGSMADVKNGFVSTGYYLKTIRDEKLWKEEGYTSFDAFLNVNYEKDKSWASRCVSLYEKFGIEISPGELPKLNPEFIDYNVSQLIEMISLPDEKRELVTAETPVRAIREMKPKREKKVETVATSEPEEKQDSLKEKQSPIERGCITGLSPYGVCSCCGNEGVKCCGECEESCNGRCGWLETVSKDSPQEKQEKGEPEIDHFLNRNESIDDAYGWFRSAMVQEYLKSGYKDQNEKCEIEVLGSVHRVLKGKEVTLFYDDSGFASFDVENTRLEREYNYFFGHHDMVETDIKKPETVIEEPESVPEQEESVPESAENVIDGEYMEVPSEPDPLEYTPRYFLEEQKEKLDNYLRIMKGKELLPADVKIIECQKTIVAALACMVAELEKPESESEPLRQEQPELPILKNNDQRAAFIDAYETWPLWIETEETGERYYRYDLSDGTSMVVKVYHAEIFDYKATSVKFEDRYHEGYGKHEYYYLQEGKFFRDCETNRSYLIDKLKELQKKGKRD